MWVVFVLATLSNTPLLSIILKSCVGCICFSNTLKLEIFFLLVLTCVGCICFSNTLKQIFPFSYIRLRVGCICFSNTLKLVQRQWNGDGSVGCICFSNTLKHRADYYIPFVVWVVFVLATLSNKICCYITVILCGLYLF